MVRARFFFFSGMAVFLGPMEDASEHRHHAMQLALGLDGPFEVQAGSKKHVAKATAIEPDCPHRFCGMGARHALLLTDPELTLSASLMGTCSSGSGVTVFDPSPIQKEIHGLRSSLDLPPDCHSVSRLCNALLQRLCGSTPEETPNEDPRVVAAKKAHAECSGQEGSHRFNRPGSGTFGKPPHSSLYGADGNPHSQVPPVVAAHRGHRAYIGECLDHRRCA